MIEDFGIGAKVTLHGVEDIMITAYDQSTTHREASERVILATFAYLGVPQTMLDLGCGPGYMCKVAYDLDCEIIQGVDTELDLPHSRCDWYHNVLIKENILKYTADQKYQLVVCLEVAEHIEESKADLLVSKLAEMAEKYLLFSAATPGQGGCGHINEQPHLYWRNKLRNAGFVENMPMTVKLRRTFSEVAPDAWWYGKNAMLFEVGQ